MRKISRIFLSFSFISGFHKISTNVSNQITMQINVSRECNHYMSSMNSWYFEICAEPSIFMMKLFELFLFLTYELHVCKGYKIYIVSDI